ncbi:MAG: DNA recombination protein RmuC [Parvibaculum sp.]|jgi:DNA recombination protein RmuC|uniref:DNA recombination protein RmuC n=1 Tax=Parvibaculum sp. TaxID=2024848 RepID=UPI000C48B34A|nr:DNA recombination protein RmuC [Parvibaculum sp.]MAU61634.1 DNA recombination protein RmuC [Parvibaculum sp.]HAC59485.1 DNA recombination protein RmuC [Rhodobiaceae bacterium]|tara:strand:+ start:686 stop:1783 length:1098 start_codon:yes stop_codon:yes gene_type:complete
MNDPLILIIVALAAAALGALAVLLLRGRNNAPDPQVSELARQQTELMGRLAAMAEAQQQTRVELTQTLHERLENVSQRMGQSLETSAQKTAETLGTLTTRLNVIDEAQKNITELSTQVVGLQDILANRQARGAFGEVQLNDIVTNALPPSAYSFQTTLGNGTRADCVIQLPNPPGPIAIDAKFPLDAYHALRNAKDDAERTVAARQFRSDLTKHVTAIAEKYIVPGETAESALMFLPSEAVYAELHASFPEVLTKSYQARVWIVSPTTLMATLNTVRAVLKDVEMRKQAGVIQKYVALLLGDVGRLNDRVGNLERHFSQAEKDIGEIRKSADAISSRGEKIEAVEMGEESAADALSPPSRESRQG